MGKSLYLSTDRSRVVEEGDASAGFLLATGDDELDLPALTSEHGEDIAKQAEKLRGKAKAEPEAETEEDSEESTRGGKTRPKADDKAVKAPPEDK